MACCLRSNLSALGKSVIKSPKNFEPLLRGAVVCFFRPVSKSILGWGILVTIPYQVSRSFGQRQGEVESLRHRQDFPPVLFKF